MRILAPLSLLFSLALTLPALAWETPAKGSAERKAMMDAMRPLAEWNLNAPVEFVVDELRVDGKLGFAMVRPQRPGGKPIDLAQTPMVQRDGFDPAYMDGAAMQALFQKQGKTWVVVHWQMGALDAWWSDPQYCGTWRPVTPEVCG